MMKKSPSVQAEVMSGIVLNTFYQSKRHFNGQANAWARDKIQPYDGLHNLILSTLPLTSGSLPAGLQKDICGRRRAYTRR